MKIKGLIYLAILIILSSCASNSRSTTAQDLQDPNEISTNYRELADYLRRVPGLQVTKRGSSYSVLVRGMSSFSGSNDPLFVVDRTQVGGYDEAAALVDPNDIERVQVLKDVASTSSYGMLGANGVIIIRTKK